MTVPEAAIDEDGNPVPREHQVRLSKNGTDVQAVPKSTGVKRLADQKFGLGVRRPDRLHVSTAGITVVNVSQPAGPTFGGSVSGYVDA